MLITFYLMQDAIDQLCAELRPLIVPVVRPFFSLVDVKSNRALCPYQYVNPSHRYVMRVFINTENSSCLGKYSSAARNYYFMQVRKGGVHHAVLS